MKLKKTKKISYPRIDKKKILIDVITVTLSKVITELIETFIKFLFH